GYGARAFAASTRARASLGFSFHFVRPACTTIVTLSLHGALPILNGRVATDAREGDQLVIVYVAVGEGDQPLVAAPIVPLQRPVRQERSQLVEEALKTACFLAGFFVRFQIGRASCREIV